MAGSLKYIVAKDGTFRMGSIENLGDAQEALEECFHIIRVLGTLDQINAACRALGYPELLVPMKRKDYEERGLI